MALHHQSVLEPKSYRLPNLQNVRQVFDAAFGSATSVQGAFGWFDAGWIGVLAYGLAEYLSRDGVAPIEFTIAPALFSTEHEALEAALTDKAQAHNDALEALIAELDRGASTASAPVTHHAVQALCWMVLNDRLRLYVAFPKAASNYHPKVWLFEDDDDAVVIRGSANATRRGMSAGIEHLDVDCSWRDRYRVEEYKKMVRDWRMGVDSMLIETVPLDLDVLKERVAVLASQHDLDLSSRPRRADLDEAFATEPVVGRGPGDTHSATFRIPAYLRWRDGPFKHQGEAVDAWEVAGRRGVFAIATGGGKTIAANICAQRSYDQQVLRGNRGPLVLIVSAPTRVLISQWDAEMREFGLDPLTPTLGSRSRRKEDLGNVMTLLGDPDSPDVVPIIVTNHRMSELGFQRAIEMGLRRARRAGKDPYVIHIGDEAHTLGARGFIENLPKFTEERLGLSATPIRQFDDDGSEAILRYFGPDQLVDPEEAIVSRFTLADAIGCGALVPYNYYVDVVYLDDQEMDSYRELTARIGQKIAMTGASLQSGDEGLTALLMQRRSILETATAKMGHLRNLLERINTERMLLYTSSKNPAQFDDAHEILHELGVSHHQVTHETTGDQRLLTRVMDDFSKGSVNCLIAKRVLDEGVNVPATKTAVLLASSTTEREWVQRLGRVLRTAEGKDRAEVYDILALPSPDQGVAGDDTSRKLVMGELDRVRRFAESSQTLAAVMERVWEIEQHYLNLGDL